MFISRSEFVVGHFLGNKNIRTIAPNKFPKFIRLSLKSCFSTVYEIAITFFCLIFKFSSE